MKSVTAHGHSPRSMPLEQMDYVDFREGFQFLNIGGCFKFSSVGI